MVIGGLLIIPVSWLQSEYGITLYESNMQGSLSTTSVPEVKIIYVPVSRSCIEYTTYNGVCVTENNRPANSSYTSYTS